MTARREERKEGGERSDNRSGGELTFGESKGLIDDTLLEVMEGEGTSRARTGRTGAVELGTAVAAGGRMGSEQSGMLAVTGFGQEFRRPELLTFESKLPMRSKQDEGSSKLAGGSELAGDSALALSTVGNSSAPVTSGIRGRSIAVPSEAATVASPSTAGAGT